MLDVVTRELNRGPKTAKELADAVGDDVKPLLKVLTSAEAVTVGDDKKYRLKPGRWTGARDAVVLDLLRKAGQPVSKGWLDDQASNLGFTPAQVYTSLSRLTLTEQVTVKRDGSRTPLYENA